MIDLLCLFRQGVLSGLLFVVLFNNSYGVTTDFESQVVGAGNLVTDPFTEVTSYSFGALSGSVAGDPIQGILASSPIGTGQAGYFGGDSTNFSLPETYGFFGTVIFSGFGTNNNIERIDAGTPLRTTTVDFVVQRNGGTNDQAFTFYGYDAVDFDNVGTDEFMAYVSIRPDNSIQIADNRIALAAAGFSYTDTGISIQEDVPYRLTVQIDYEGATWSATIDALDDSESFTVATDRSINTDGYTLSAWTTETTIDIEMGGGLSATNKGLADRLIFDNLNSTFSARPPLDLPVTFSTLPVGASNLISDPFSGFSGFMSIDGVGVNTVGDNLHGVLANAPIGTGRAGYLGGDGISAELPSEDTFVYFLTFPADPSVTLENRTTSNKPVRSVLVDFLVERNGGTNNQEFAFYVFDGIEEANTNVFGYHSYIRIKSNNQLAIADNSVDLAAAGFIYEDTPYFITPGTAYRLHITIDYVNATWSAVVASLDGNEVYPLAYNRSINSDAYQLTGWTNAAGVASLDIEMTAFGSASNNDFADRLLFDNIYTMDMPKTVSTDFEDYTTGAGQFLTEGQTDSGSFVYGAFSGSPDNDPIQGILETSPLGTGKAAYLGGDGTNYPLMEGDLPFFGIGTFTGEGFVNAQRIYAGTQLKTVSVDFLIERNGGTNNQDFTFFIFDPLGLQTGTSGSYGFVRISSSNELMYADNRSYLINNNFTYLSTGVTLQSDKAYQLRYRIDYFGATWSAEIVALDDSEVITIVTDRNINSDGYELSGWATSTTIDVEMSGSISQSNADLADRLIFDNLSTTHSVRPPLDLPVTFDTLAVGPSNLATNPFSGFFASYLAGNNQQSADDPVHGVLPSSPIGSGRAGYIGGDSTNIELPPEDTFLRFLTFPANPGDTLENRSLSTQPIRKISTDFVVERNAGTNNQAFSFYIFDGSDLDNNSTTRYHSYVRIAPDNSIGIADNRNALEASNYAFTGTPYSIIPGKAYTLSYEINYLTATWSASIIALDESSEFILAKNRPMNTAGYELSGWTNAEGIASLDIEMIAFASANNKALADRLIFDNITTVDSPAGFSSNFDTFETGSGKLITDPSSGFTGFIFGGLSGSALNDPIQGILETSPLNTGKAGYIGGNGTNIDTASIVETTYFNTLVFPGAVGDPVENRLDGGEAIRTVTADFIVQRNGGTNNQSFSFYVFDGGDPEIPNSEGYHSFIFIDPSNSILVADNEQALNANGYISIGRSITPGRPYTLTITIDYLAKTWSGVIRQIDGTEVITVAKNRSINSDGYEVSGWTTNISLDIQQNASLSPGNTSLLDRLIFDNIKTVDSVRPDLDWPVSFSTLPIGEGNIVTNPFSGFLGFTLADGTVATIGDPIQGVLPSSPIGSGPAGYLGGAGTNSPLPSEATNLRILVFPAYLNIVPEDRATSDKQVRTISTDFVVQRNAGTNTQAFLFYLWDALDQSDGGTFTYHSYVRIAADNSIEFADNRAALNANAGQFTSTAFWVEPDTVYRLTLITNYANNTWSAIIAAKDGSARYNIAKDRALNTNGYTLSGWTNAAGQSSLDIGMTATVSDTNRDLLDRLIIDNIHTTEAIVGETFSTQLEAAGVPLDKRGPLDDADGDGIPNLIEFALGGNPALPSSQSLPQPQIVDGKIVLNYTQAAPTKVIYVVESTTDLSDPDSWTVLDVEQGDTDESGNTSASSSADGQFRYLRIKVILLEP